MMDIYNDQYGFLERSVSIFRTTTFSVKKTSTETVIDAPTGEGSDHAAITKQRAKGASTQRADWVGCGANNNKCYISCVR